MKFLKLKFFLPTCSFLIILGLYTENLSSKEKSVLEKNDNIIYLYSDNDHQGNLQTITLKQNDETTNTCTLTIMKNLIITSKLTGSCAESLHYEDFIMDNILNLKNTLQQMNSEKV